MAQVLSQTALRVVAAPRLGAVQRPLGSVRQTRAFAVSNGARATMERPLWLPGQPAPPYLDGTLPGDFGFDPFGLAEVPSDLARYAESELIHSRWAMLGVVGILVPEIIGQGNWVEAQAWLSKGGAPTYLGAELPWGSPFIIVIVNALALAWSEAKRNEETDPEKRKYPGGAFDPLGFSKDAAAFEKYKVNELRNGRLAITAILGYFIQAAARPGTGPVENLIAHLQDPWHINISEIIIPRSIL